MQPKGPTPVVTAFRLFKNPFRSIQNFTIHRIIWPWLKGLSIKVRKPLNSLSVFFFFTLPPPPPCHNTDCHSWGRSNTSLTQLNLAHRKVVVRERWPAPDERPRPPANKNHDTQTDRHVGGETDGHVGGETDRCTSIDSRKKQEKHCVHFVFNDGWAPSRPPCDQSVLLQLGSQNIRENNKTESKRNDLCVCVSVLVFMCVCVCVCTQWRQVRSQLISFED